MLKQLEAPPSKEIDPPEAEEPKQVTMAIVKKEEQPEPVKVVEPPKEEEVKAPAEPMPESKSPIKEGSFSEYL